jgi:hypothetical protein
MLLSKIIVYCVIFFCSNVSWDRESLHDCDSQLVRCDCQDTRPSGRGRIGSAPPGPEYCKVGPRVRNLTVFT